MILWIEILSFLYGWVYETIDSKGFHNNFFFLSFFHFSDFYEWSNFYFLCFLYKMMKNYWSCKIINFMIPLVVFFLLFEFVFINKSFILCKHLLQYFVAWKNSIQLYKGILKLELDLSIFSMNALAKFFNHFFLGIVCQKS